MRQSQLAQRRSIIQSSPNIISAAVNLRGRSISATNDLGVTHGAEIDNAVFERLHAGVDEDGQQLLTNAGDVAKRVAGIDLTLSAPKSVSIIFALADDETRRAIEAAQQRACEATISFLDRHAAFCRRGRNGLHWNAPR